MIEESEQIERYRRVGSELEALLTEELDAVAAMASFASVLHHALPQASWTGFYRRISTERLQIGPYQGKPGCTEIPFDRGVCGAAAREHRTHLVDDVHAFPGHIACDVAAKSEIVVPVYDSKGELVAVLDVDSLDLAAFDEVDRAELERLVRLLTPFL